MTTPPPTRAPGPRGLPLLGSALPFRKDLVGFMLNAWRQYGDIVRLNIRGKTVHRVSHPEHIQHVLVARRDNYYKGYGYHDQKLLLGEGLITSEGELWERQHRLMQPHFTPRCVADFADIMIDATRRMLERWGPAEGDQAIQVDDEMARLTGNIIVRILFDRDLDDETSPLDEAFQYCIGFIDKRSADLIALPMFLPTAANRRFKHHLASLYHYIDERVSEHRRDPGADDFLSVLLGSQSDDGESMSDTQLRDELVTLFVAGYQTTMHALTWTWYLLDQHPPVLARLLEEQQAVLGDRELTPADLRELSFTSMVFQEAMRLYPPVKVIVRQAREADAIAGFHIPAGSLILISPYITHRHPDLWPDPEQFDPQRFAPEQVEQRSRYAHIPFSAGPRICLGGSFSLLEASIVLSMVTRRYRLRLVPGHPVFPSMNVKTPPLYGMPMTLHPRT